MTKNFKISEFDCKDGIKVPIELMHNLHKLATNIQIIRDNLDAPITINSGYRTKSHNKKVGGASKSYHLTADAGDLKQNKETPLQLYKRIERLINDGLIHDGGLILYNTFVHYDTRKVPYRANYSTIFKL